MGREASQPPSRMIDRNVRPAPVGEPDHVAEPPPFRTVAAGIGAVVATLVLLGLLFFADDEPAESSPAPAAPAASERSPQG